MSASHVKFVLLSLPLLMGAIGPSQISPICMLCGDTSVYTVASVVPPDGSAVAGESLRLVVAGTWEYSVNVSGPEIHSICLHKLDPNGEWQVLYNPYQGGFERIDGEVYSVDQCHRAREITLVWPNVPLPLDEETFTFKVEWWIDGSDSFIDYIDESEPFTYRRE